MPKVKNVCCSDPGGPLNPPEIHYSNDILNVRVLPAANTECMDAIGEHSFTIPWDGDFGSGGTTAGSGQLIAVSLQCLDPEFQSFNVTLRIKNAACDSQGSEDAGDTICDPGFSHQSVGPIIDGVCCGSDIDEYFVVEFVDGIPIPPAKPKRLGTVCIPPKPNTCCAQPGAPPPGSPNAGGSPGGGGAGGGIKPLPTASRAATSAGFLPSFSLPPLPGFPPSGILPGNPFTGNPKQKQCCPPSAGGGGGGTGGGGGGG